MTEYDEDCLACQSNDLETGTYYDDHVHKDDVYPKAGALDADDAEYEANRRGYTTKDSGERQQFASGMQRDVTTGKTRWHLISYGPMLKRWAELMTRGAIKYDDNNWMKANSEVEYDRFKASAFRHFMQWYTGDTDEDHAAATIFNMNGAEYVKDRLDARPIVSVYGHDTKARHEGWNCGVKGCPDA